MLDGGACYGDGDQRQRKGGRRALGVQLDTLYPRKDWCICAGHGYQATQEQGKSQLQQCEKTFYKKILANWLKATSKDLTSHEFQENQDKRILKLVRINV